MLVIREKANPLKIKAYGFTEPGGLGEFDSAVYEEVKLVALPENWELSKEQQLAMGRGLVEFLEKQIADTLNDDFQSIEIITKLGGLRDFLNSGASNPLPAQRFNNCKIALEQQAPLLSINSQQVELIISLINSWAGTVKFTD